MSSNVVNSLNPAPNDVAQIVMLPVTNTNARWFSFIKDPSATWAEVVEGVSAIVRSSSFCLVYIPNLS